MCKPMILIALLLSSSCALAQVVGDAGTAAGSGSAHTPGEAGRGAPGSTVVIGRQIGTLPRVNMPTPGTVGQLSLGVSLPMPSLPLVQNSPATMGTLGTNIRLGTVTTGTYAPGVIQLPRP
jgi:hypothetical protein